MVLVITGVFIQETMKVAATDNNIMLPLGLRSVFLASSRGNKGSGPTSCTPGRSRRSFSSSTRMAAAKSPLRILERLQEQHEDMRFGS